MATQVFWSMLFKLKYQQERKQERKSKTVNENSARTTYKLCTVK